MNKNIIGKSVHLYNGEYLAQLFSCCGQEFFEAAVSY